MRREGQDKADEERRTCLQHKLGLAPLLALLALLVLPLLMLPLALLDTPLAVLLSSADVALVLLVVVHLHSQRGRGRKGRRGPFVEEPSRGEVPRGETAVEGQSVGTRGEKLHRRGEHAVK